MGIELDEDGGFVIPALTRLIQQTVDDLEKRHTEGSGGGMPTLLTEWDSCTGGIHEGRLYVFGGRMKQGKTTLGLNIVRNLCRQGYPTAVFSMEMGRQALIEKFLSLVGQIDSFRMRMGGLSDEEFERVSKAAATLYDYPLHIIDRRAATAEWIANITKKLVAEKGIRTVLVDYCQLLGGVGNPAHYRLELVRAVHRLQALAGEAKVAVVLLAQLGRTTDDRQNAMPEVRDLQETSSMEQDADVVTLIHHLPKGQPNSEYGNMMELVIAANRHGMAKTCKVWFDPNICQVRDPNDKELWAEKMHAQAEQAKKKWKPRMVSGEKDL